MNLVLDSRASHSGGCFDLGSPELPDMYTDFRARDKLAQSSSARVYRGRLSRGGIVAFEHMELLRKLLFHVAVIFREYLPDG